MKLSIVVEQDGVSETICTYTQEPPVTSGGEVKDVTDEVLKEINRWIKLYFGVKE